jgi:hypothetical protein
MLWDFELHPKSKVGRCVPICQPPKFGEIWTSENHQFEYEILGV